MSYDRYGSDVLAAGWKDAGRKPVPEVPAVRDLVVEEAATGFCGAVVRLEAHTVELEDYFGKKRVFPLGGGFLIDGEPVVLVMSKKTPEAGRARTASGSFAVAEQKARVALPSRIFVEGRHDAELVERVWGDDLRIEGVVVERLDGIDHLDRAIAEFRPGPARRLGVLVDHLVDGSKESRIAERLRQSDVLITGTPFVDVWQAVRPSVLGIRVWPHIPKGTEWKAGVCEALGFGDPPAAWRRILASVSSYADLDPALVGAVERLIDFVTATD